LLPNKEPKIEDNRPGATGTGGGIFELSEN
jgi:hypothetical protein